MVIALQVSKQPPGASSPRRLHPKSLREPPVHTCMSQSPPDSEHKLTINIKNPSQHFSGRDTLKKLNRQLEKVADSFGNYTDI